MYTTIDTSLTSDTTDLGDTGAVNGTTVSGARRRTDDSIIGRLNLEWARLRTSPSAAADVSEWARSHAELSGCAGVADIEARVAAADREGADRILLALLELAVDDPLAGRVVLQLMLGKAVRIAARHTGRTDRDLLEQLAVTALWDVIATYPIHRRRRKVAANLAMDTLRQVVAELAPDKVERPVEPDAMLRHATTDAEEVTGQVVDLEILEVLAWGVDHDVLSRDDAALLMAVYSPAAGEAGGAAAAEALGLTWAAARQRCSRAVRRLSAAVREDLIGLSV